MPPVTAKKRDQISFIESEHSTMASKEESLKRQVSLMQQRLTQSAQELKQLQVGDIHAKFKTVEQERDVLLDFIQG